MAFKDTIESLIKDNTIASVLVHKTPNKNAAKALQNILYAIGFDEELNWAKYGADGDYGTGTTNALLAFGKLNSFETDGLSVSIEMGQRILDLYNIVDDLYHLDEAMEAGTPEKILYRKSNKKVTIVALQNLLYFLGYAEELNWANYGADGDYGTGSTNAVKAFAEKEGLAETNGEQVTMEIAQKIMDKLSPFYGANWQKTSESTLTGGELKIVEKVIRGKKKVYVSDDTASVRFSKFKHGVFLYGKQKAKNFIDKNREGLEEMGITTSALNVMLPVSENEGNLDAINTWDNSFMTFGMFQWTIGSSTNKGELPALLKKIKEFDPSLFHRYFGIHGLDVTGVSDNVYGYLSLNGVRMRLVSEKNQFRSYKWSFYFWKAGQDENIQAIEIHHALSRLHTFYWNPGYKVNGRLVKEYVTSEYGVALILDHHVNRPAHIRKHLTRALQALGWTGQDPSKWDTAKERKLIAKYLEIREGSSMTNPVKRANTTKAFLREGVISDERGSFQYELKSRSADNTSPYPSDFKEEAYPIIMEHEYLD